MTNDKGILIHNIYYMLAYAFQVLNQEHYRDVASENFCDAENLFAAILAKGISSQVKQGLYREYSLRQEDLPSLRGKLEINGTIRHQIRRERILSCEYDELSEENMQNRILKTTAVVLIRAKTVELRQKQALRRVLPYLSQIEPIAPSSIPWNQIRKAKCSRSYEMLLCICRFVLQGMLQTTQDGQCKLMEFSESHMNHLYEVFILEYFKKHHPNLHPSASQVKWDIMGSLDPASARALPVMQTDIVLHSGEKTLIIDAKYYSHSMQFYRDRYSVHSGNLYQIFAYVKNQQAAQPGLVFGLLLYAKTDEDIAPDFSFPIGGNPISVKTLDLNRPFQKIAMQLDAISDAFENAH